MFHLLLDIPPIREAEVLYLSSYTIKPKSVELGGGGGGGGSARLPIGIIGITLFLCLYYI